MVIIDKKGRLFGKINIFDFFVLISISMCVGGLVGTKTGLKIYNKNKNELIFKCNTKFENEKQNLENRYKKKELEYVELKLKVNILEKQISEYKKRMQKEAITKNWLYI